MSEKIFNREKFLAQLGGSEELASRIGCCVLRDFERNLKGLNTALGKEDVAEIIFYIHGIKGVAATARCERLFELARDLEQIARAGNITACLEKIGELIELTRKSSEQLKADLKEPVDH